MHSPLSSTFDGLVRQSGRRKTVIDVYYDGRMVEENLRVSEGSLRFDLDGQSRGSGSVTVADPRLVPTLTNTLAPHGTEVRVRQGVVHPNETEELIPMGIFRVELAGWGERTPAVTIQLYDRSKALQVDAPYPFSHAGKPTKQVIIEILEFFLPFLAPLDPNAVFDPGLDDYTIPGGQVFDGGSCWDFIDGLAKNLGGQISFDRSGFPRCKKIVDMSEASQPVYTIDAGPNGVLVDATRSYSREGVYNAVTVIGSSSGDGDIPRATAYNLDAGSPVRYGGPFGKVTLPINDSSLTTTAQCLTRASVELKKFSGLSYSLNFSAVPNPALDVGDIIKVVYPDDTAELHQIVSLSIPLGRGEFSGSSTGVFVNG